jgi:calcium uniporter protein, mitochondrial
MGLQFGIMARMTYWEYSWDIVEPLSYFVGQATTMLAASYFIIKGQDFEYGAARDRKALEMLHKAAKKNNFSVDDYNTLKVQLSEAESLLQRIRGH